jgi:hypothetical protein
MHDNFVPLFAKHSYEFKNYATAKINSSREDTLFWFSYSKQTSKIKPASTVILVGTNI